MYTKGEWRISDMPLPSRGFVRIRANCVEVARIYKQGRGKYYGVKQLEPEIQANAQLIAAAPRLHEWIKGKADEGDNDAKVFLSVLGLE